MIKDRYLGTNPVQAEIREEFVFQNLIFRANSSRDIAELMKT